MRSTKFNYTLINDVCGEPMDYYYLNGECPEMMSFRRVCDYAEEIIQSNKDDPEILVEWVENGTVVTLDHAEEVIRWFGEELIKIDFKESV